MRGSVRHVVQSMTIIKPENESKKPTLNNINIATSQAELESNRPKFVENFKSAYDDKKTQRVFANLDDLQERSNVEGGYRDEEEEDDDELEDDDVMDRLRPQENSFFYEEIPTVRDYTKVQLANYYQKYCDPKNGDEVVANAYNLMFTRQEIDNTINDYSCAPSIMGFYFKFLQNSLELSNDRRTYFLMFVVRDFDREGQALQYDFVRSFKNKFRRKAQTINNRFKKIVLVFQFDERWMAAILNLGESKCYIVDLLTQELSRTSKQEVWDLVKLFTKRELNMRMGSFAYLSRKCVSSYQDCGLFICKFFQKFLLEQAELESLNVEKSEKAPLQREIPWLIFKIYQERPKKFHVVREIKLAQQDTIQPQQTPLLSPGIKPNNSELPDFVKQATMNPQGKELARRLTLFGGGISPIPLKTGGLPTATQSGQKKKSVFFESNDMEELKRQGTQGQNGISNPITTANLPTAGKSPDPLKRQSTKNYQSFIGNAAENQPEDPSKRQSVTQAEPPTNINPLLGFAGGYAPLSVMQRQSTKTDDPIGTAGGQPLQSVMQKSAGNKFSFAHVDDKLNAQRDSVLENPQTKEPSAVGENKRENSRGSMQSGKPLSEKSRDVEDQMKMARKSMLDSKDVKTRKSRLEPLDDDDEDEEEEVKKSDKIRLRKQDIVNMFEEVRRDILRNQNIESRESLSRFLDEEGAFDGRKSREVFTKNQMHNLIQKFKTKYNLNDTRPKKEPKNREPTYEEWVQSYQEYMTEAAEFHNMLNYFYQFNPALYEKVTEELTNQIEDKMLAKYNLLHVKYKPIKPEKRIETPIKFLETEHKEPEIQQGFNAGVNIKKKPEPLADKDGLFNRFGDSHSNNFNSSLGRNLSSKDLRKSSDNAFNRKNLPKTLPPINESTQRGLRSSNEFSRILEDQYKSRSYEQIEVLVHKYGIGVLKHELYSLRKEGTVSENILNFYANYLKERAVLKLDPKSRGSGTQFYVFGTDFYRALTGGDPLSKNINAKVISGYTSSIPEVIFEKYATVLILAQLASHHFLLVKIEGKSKRVTLYDSGEKSGKSPLNHPVMFNISQFIEQEYERKGKKHADLYKWQYSYGVLAQHKTEKESGLIICNQMQKIFEEIPDLGAASKEELASFKKELITVLMTQSSQPQSHEISGVVGRF